MVTRMLSGPGCSPTLCGTATENSHREDKEFLSHGWVPRVELRPCPSSLSLLSDSSLMNKIPKSPSNTPALECWDSLRSPSMPLGLSSVEAH